MKRTKKYPHLKIYKPNCPNGADPQYFADKAADLLLSIAAVIGFTTAMVFLASLA